MSSCLGADFFPKSDVASSANAADGDAEESTTDSTLFLTENETQTRHRSALST